MINPFPTTFAVPDDRAIEKGKTPANGVQQPGGGNYFTFFPLLPGTLQCMPKGTILKTFSVGKRVEAAEEKQGLAGLHNKWTGSVWVCQIIAKTYC